MQFISLVPWDYSFRRWHWLALAALILVADFLAGPFVHFPLLLALPVALATWTDGRPLGITTALLLPTIKLSYIAVWGAPGPWPLAIIDAMVDVVVLLGLVYLLDRVIRQQRQIRVLQGILPICGFCKRIRSSEQWRQLEAFISEHSEAQFSHTFCPDCGKQHYGGFLD